MAGHRVTETTLFNLLRKREKSDGFEASQISSRVNAVVEEAWPILHQISSRFPFYTLHDTEHSFRVAQHMANLTPKETLSNLNSIELSILLYSAYLHDIGMASSENEFQEWLDSPDFDSFIAVHSHWAHSLRKIEEHEDMDDTDDDQNRKASPGRKVNTSLHQIQDAMYTDFLRENHADRGANYVQRFFGEDGQSNNRISVSEINYATNVALVCKSHYDATLSLLNEQYRRDLYISTLPVNLQYCAILLRLADVIDLDPDRAPRVLVDFLALDFDPRRLPKTQLSKARQKSAKEWAKHRSVLGYKVSADEIRIEANCGHPELQRGLREWCDYIDLERRDCRLVVQENRSEIAGKYKLTLTEEVRKEYIRSNGSYIYTDFQFELDYDRIAKLLMGTELWGDPALLIRELLQNAIDACNHRRALSARKGVAYKPQINFHLKRTGSDMDCALVLECEDNGVGMDQHIVENFLMQIGRSYYESSEFRHQDLNFAPISHFGLGIMSCFMMSDAIEIETQRLDRELKKGEALSVEIDSSARFIVLRHMNTDREGTNVSLPIQNRQDSREKRSIDFFHPMMFLDALPTILSELAIHVDIPIVVNWLGQEQTIGPDGFELPKIPWDEKPCIRGTTREFNFEFDYEDTGGLAGKFRFILPCANDGTVHLGCPVGERFKLFSDPDGDVCLTTPSYKDNRLSIHFESIDEDWDDDEVRGIYRDRFNRKPREKLYDGRDDILEIVEGSFRWSQDGLLVAPLEYQTNRMRMKEREEPKAEEGKPNLFSHITVPGLNSADIDLRGPWRVSLNVQRTEFIRGPSLDGFIKKYLELQSEMWKNILEELEISPDTYSDSVLIQQLYSMASWNFQTQLEKTLGFAPDKERKRRAWG